jgi:hypothetical protein
MLSFALIVMLACSSLVHARYLNLHGDPLQKCSHTGMALTGYTRSGQCYAHVSQSNRLPLLNSVLNPSQKMVFQDDDHGSHHVCIDLSSTTGGNFCTVTVPAPLPRFLRTRT